MTFDPLVRVWAGLRQAGRCKYCRKPIVWLTTDEAKSLPFTAGFTVHETVTHPERQTQFHVVARSDIHDCQQKRDAKRAAPRQTKRPRLF